MTLRKITIGISVRYVSKDDHSLSEQAPPLPNVKKKNTSNIIDLSERSTNLLDLLQQEENLNSVNE